MIAGHVFALDAAGRCSCGRTWADIAATSAADVGHTGIAHTAYLSSAEYEQIAAERERIWAITVGSVASAA